MAWPSSSARTKNWGTEILTDADLEAQLDLLHSYLNDSLNGTTGHTHTGGTADSPKIPLATSVSGTLPATNGGTGTATVTQGDIIYGSASNVWSKLAAGTAGMSLITGGAAANPAWGNISVLVSTTRDMTAASGSQTVTGAGFTPKRLIVFASVDSTKGVSFGMDDATTSVCIYMDSSSDWQHRATAISLIPTGGTLQTAVVASFNSDGCSLTWTKTGSPTGTANIYIMFIR